MNYNNLTPEVQEALEHFLETYLVAFLSISLVVCIISIVAMWRLFTKAGEKGWKAIIPIYNVYIYFKIAGVPSLFWVLLIVSVLSVIPNMIVSVIALLIDAVITIYQAHKLSTAFAWRWLHFRFNLLKLNLYLNVGLWFLRIQTRRKLVITQSLFLC